MNKEIKEKCNHDWKLEVFKKRGIDCGEEVYLPAVRLLCHKCWAHKIVQSKLINPHG